LVAVKWESSSFREGSSQYLRCAPGRQRGCLVAVALVGFSMIRRHGACMGHEKSAKVTKYCKQRILVAISSH
ncbi:hypothetical protein NQ130_18815, partial [Klebsiella quasipneumoniae]|uniref:hypothetical protein n=1 Tax=Klebsiella quasipneumoniae TaxID=1463165 RepID=UPI002562C29A